VGETSRRQLDGEHLTQIDDGSPCVLQRLLLAGFLRLTLGLRLAFGGFLRLTLSLSLLLSSFLRLTLSLELLRVFLFFRRKQHFPVLAHAQPQQRFSVHLHHAEPAPQLLAPHTVLVAHRWTLPPSTLLLPVHLPPPAPLPVLELRVVHHQLCRPQLLVFPRRHHVVLALLLRHHLQRKGRHRVIVHHPQQERVRAGFRRQGGAGVKVGGDALAGVEALPVDELVGADKAGAALVGEPAVREREQQETQEHLEGGGAHVVGNGVKSGVVLVLREGVSHGVTGEKVAREPWGQGGQRRGPTGGPGRSTPHPAGTPAERGVSPRGPWRRARGARGRRPRRRRASRW
jgi:hypothetical protein